MITLERKYQMKEDCEKGDLLAIWFEEKKVMIGKYLSNSSYTPVGYATQDFEKGEIIRYSLLENTTAITSNTSPLMDERIYSPEVNSWECIDYETTTPDAYNLVDESCRPVG